MPSGTFRRGVNIKNTATFIPILSRMYRLAESCRNFRRGNLEVRAPRGPDSHHLLLRPAQYYSRKIFIRSTRRTSRGSKPPPPPSPSRSILRARVALKMSGVVIVIYERNLRFDINLLVRSWLPRAFIFRVLIYNNLAENFAESCARTRDLRPSRNSAAVTSFYLGSIATRFWITPKVSETIPAASVAAVKTGDYIGRFLLAAIYVTNTRVVI